MDYIKQQHAQVPVFVQGLSPVHTLQPHAVPRMLAVLTDPDSVLSTPYSSAKLMKLREWLSYRNR